MLTRTTSAKVVNGMLRTAFSDEAMDVSEAVKSRKNYAFVSDDAVVVFTRRKRDKTTYSAMLGVLPGSQRKGIGTNVLNEGIAWMYANTKAQTVLAVIDPKNKGINKITSRIRIHGTERATMGGGLLVTCTRESWTAMFPGRSDV